MTIPKGTPPASVNGDSNWEVAHKIQTLVTDTVFGKNANIGGFMATNSQLQSINGSLTLDGIHGVISLFHEKEGYTWCVKENGKQVMGVEGGQRIEFDPSDKEIRIYNDKGTAVANLSGKEVASISEIFGDNEVHLNLILPNKKGGQTIAPTEGKRTASDTIQIGKASTKAAARLSFQGTLTVFANTVQTDGEGMMDDQGRYWYKNSATIILRVVTYADSTKGSVISSKQVKYLTSRGDKDPLTFDLSTTQIDVPAGYHELYLDYSLDAIGNYFGSSKAEASWEITDVTFGINFYLSRLFGNGFAYGSSPNNYIAAINDNGKMRHKMVTGNCGYDIYNGTIKIMLNSVWYTMSRKADGTVLLTE